MAFKGVKEAAAKRTAEYMDHVREEIRTVADKGDRIDQATWDQLHPMNSYELNLLYPLLNNDVLIRLIKETMLPNCQRDYHSVSGIPGCYDDAVIFTFVPLLIKRLQEHTCPEIPTKDLVEELVNREGVQTGVISVEGQVTVQVRDRRRDLTETVQGPCIVILVTD